VRERLEEKRRKLSTDPDLHLLTQEERDRSSGEIHALLWALGEDFLSRGVRTIMEEHDNPDPSHTDRALPNILIHFLEEGPNIESRASAAYDLGMLHVTAAIPALAAALEDVPEVAEVALRALTTFTDQELDEAGIPAETQQRVRNARGR
jgi:HEAT repeat protein